MKAIIRFEVVQGQYEGRDKKIHDYETLKLYTMTISEDAPIWHPAVDLSSQYEQTTACGGFRERTRRWIKKEDIAEGRTGVNVNVFESISVRMTQLEDLLGVKDLAEFESVFMEGFFLHPVTVVGIPNDYGRLEITEINVSAKNVIEVLKEQRAKTPVN